MKPIFDLDVIQRTDVWVIMLNGDMVGRAIGAWGNARSFDLLVQTYRHKVGDNEIPFSNSRKKIASNNVTGGYDKRESAWRNAKFAGEFVETYSDNDFVIGPYKVIKVL